MTLGSGFFVAAAIAVPQDTSNSDIGTETPGDEETDEETSGEADQSQNGIKTSHLIWLTILLLAMGVVGAISLKQLNAFIRRNIARIAKALKMSILGAEASLACLAWSGLTVIMSFILPPAAIASLALLALNLACALLAWLIYSREKYQI